MAGVGISKSVKLPSALLLTALGSYVSATLLGVLLRYDFVRPFLGWRFENLVHAHSHTLYFGWAGLAVWSLVLGLVPSTSRITRLCLIGSATLVPVLFLAFLVGGYTLMSIAISTLLMLFWYGAVAGWLRGSRNETSVAVSYLRIGFYYVVIASLGIWMLAYLQASGHPSQFYAKLAVHSFLFNFGWFFIFALLALLMGRGGFDDLKMKRALAWWAPVALLFFPLGVSGGPEMAGLGPLARVAAVVGVYPASIVVRQLWGWKGSPTARVLAFWLAVKMSMEVAVAAGGSAVIDAGGRSGVVIYLHVFLLGFVTTGLAALHSPSGERMAVHTVALGAMVAGLALTIVGAAGGDLVGVGLWVAAGAALVLWIEGLRWVGRASHRIETASDS